MHKSRTVWAAAAGLTGIALAVTGALPALDVMVHAANGPASDFSRTKEWMHACPPAGVCTHHIGSTISPSRKRVVAMAAARKSFRLTISRWISVSMVGIVS